ncbi:hypothetical protein PsorP6_013282 [Peronosclerospora sorghi]|uniref:Uncharacterized protein n=1 Tax=Peronosclerospora sorghi TaxID=230839 RepID=A0ACC0WGH0_9STRA|nr:hypothetical protein PsorP6_013282 [Peronosclerospora sorghi]
MNIRLILLLASSAHLTGNTFLVVAAGSEYLTTENKPKFESTDDNRSTTSERSLRVRAKMDEEDEERGAIFDARNSFFSRAVNHFRKPPSTVEDKVTKIFQRYHKEGVINSAKTLRTIRRLVKKRVTPDRFVTALALNPKDELLAEKLLLLDEFLKVFYRRNPESKHVTAAALASTPLVAQGMKPGELVTALKLDPSDTRLASKLLFIDEFVDAFNHGKLEPERVTVAQALKSTPRSALIKHLVIGKQNAESERALDMMLKKSADNLDEFVSVMEIKNHMLDQPRVREALLNFAKSRHISVNDAHTFMHERKKLHYRDHAVNLILTPG